MWFSQVLLNSDKEIYNIFNSILFPITLIQTGVTNSQTHTQQLSLIVKINSMQLD